MKKRNVLNSPRLSELKQKRRRVVFTKIFIAVLAISVIVALLSIFSRLPGLNINEVKVADNNIVDEEAVKDLADKELAGKYFWLFSKTNILFYPQNKIRNSLLTQFPRIKDAKLSIENNRNTLTISIAEREPEYMWCGGIIPSLRSDDRDPKCYFMDSQGFIFDKAPYFSPGVYFKFYGDLGVDGQSPEGKYFFQDKFNDLIEFKNIIERLDLKVGSFWQDNQGNASFYLETKSVASPFIIFKADGDFEQIAQNLETAIAAEPLKTEFKDKYSSLLYIDLRFDNKVYYKFSQ